MRIPYNYAKMNNHRVACSGVFGEHIAVDDFALEHRSGCAPDRYEPERLAKARLISDEQRHAGFDSSL